MKANEPNAENDNLAMNGSEEDQQQKTLQIPMQPAKEANQRSKSRKKRSAKVQKMSHYLKNVPFNHQLGLSNKTLSSVEDWNNRFQVTTSTLNKVMHPFYREYFDKKPKQAGESSRIKNATSSNVMFKVSAKRSK